MRRTRVRVSLRGLALLVLACALWGAAPVAAREAAPPAGSEAASEVAGAPPAIRDIGVEEAKALLANPPAGLVILDVRTPQEFREGHLAGARNMDFFGGPFEAQAEALPPDAPVLLYCRSGRRSASAAEALGQAGHRRVLNMSGGTESWTRAGLPLVK